MAAKQTISIEPFVKFIAVDICRIVLIDLLVKLNGQSFQFRVCQGGRQSILRGEHAHLHLDFFRADERVTDCGNVLGKGGFGRRDHEDANCQCSNGKKYKTRFDTSVFHRMTSLIPTFKPKADVRTFLYAGMVLFVGMPRIYF